MFLLLWKSRVQVSQLGSKEGSKEGRRTKLHSCGFAPYTLYWRSGTFLWVFLLCAVRILSERASKQVWRLKYFLLQLYKREHFVLHIWDIRPIPTIRTTVRIIRSSARSSLWIRAGIKGKRRHINIVRYVYTYMQVSRYRYYYGPIHWDLEPDCHRCHSLGTLSARNKRKPLWGSSKMGCRVRENPVRHSILKHKRRPIYQSLSFL